MVDAQYANLSSKIFFMWGSLCIISVVFAYFLVPETKGLSLEQVDRMMEEVVRSTPSNAPMRSMTSSICATEEVVATAIRSASPLTECSMARDNRRAAAGGGASDDPKKGDVIDAEFEETN